MLVFLPPLFSLLGGFLFPILIFQHTMVSNTRGWMVEVWLVGVCVVRGVCFWWDVCEKCKFSKVGEGDGGWLVLSRES